MQNAAAGRQAFRSPDPITLPSLGPPLLCSYVFQIFAQLLEVRPPGTPVPEAYHAIFPPLLTPTFWERSGNVPALVRLLQAYLARAGPDVVSRGYLQASAWGLPRLQRGLCMVGWHTTCVLLLRLASRLHRRSC